MILMNKTEKTELLLEIVLDIDNKLRRPKPVFWDFPEMVAEALGSDDMTVRLMTVGQVLNGYLALCKTLPREEAIFFMESLSCDASKLLDIDNLFFYD